MNRPVCAVALAFFVVSTVFVRASSAESHTDDALVASKNWVAQIDAGAYQDSYAFGCDAMKEKVPQDRWVQVLTALRTPWGPAVSRKQLSHVFERDGYDGLAGECMVITYDVSFSKMDPAQEVVVLKWEDGKWRGAGYNAGPKPTDDGSAPARPQSTTELQTQAHVRPQPQTPESSQ
jgi:hypothetical protein